MTSGFRPDIQGLRALAVVPIVLLHAGIDLLPGGFLGVDIFFVISGYLITRILTNEMSASNFSFLRFYQRRAIRLFPAFAFMMVITTFVGFFVMIRPIFDLNAESARYAPIFLSNLYFWRNTDYFIPSAHIYMYLHTWSLAVEEQFYLIYPMLLTIVYRYANLWLGRIILVSVAASFVVSLLFYFHASGLAFFLLPSRAWQLGLGAIVALQLLPAIRSGVIRKSVSLVGLAMILASLIFIDESWQIPAPWALPASLGTALLIAYGRKGPTATILSFAPFVWIGTISYSLYLWHWPIMVLHNVSSNHPTTEMQTAGIIMASVIMGAVSFYFVERPALQRCIALPAGSTVVAGGVAMASLALAAITVSKVPESFSTFPPEARRVASYFNYHETPQAKDQTRQSLCFSDLGTLKYDTSLCTRHIPGRPTLALIGDSHAAQYYLALQKRNPTNNLIQVTGAACSLLVGVSGDDRCDRLNHIFYSDVLDRHFVKRVILVQRWTKNDLPFLQKTIFELKSRNISVTVIGPVTEYSDSFPLLLANAIRSGRPSDLEKSRLIAPSDLEALLADNVPRWGGQYYSVQAAECPNGACRYLTPDGTPIHHDYGHVTQSGAEFLLRFIPQY